MRSRPCRALSVEKAAGPSPVRVSLLKPFGQARLDSVRGSFRKPRRGGQRATSHSRSSGRRAMPQRLPVSMASRKASTHSTPRARAYWATCSWASPLMTTTSGCSGALAFSSSRSSPATVLWLEETALQRRFPRDRRGRLGSLRRNREHVPEGGEVMARFPIGEAAREENMRTPLEAVDGVGHLAERRAQPDAVELGFVDEIKEQPRGGLGDAPCCEPFPVGRSEGFFETLRGDVLDSRQERILFLAVGGSPPCARTRRSCRCPLPPAPPRRRRAKGHPKPSRPGGTNKPRGRRARRRAARRSGEAR